LVQAGPDPRRLKPALLNPLARINPEKRRGEIIES
jgi:hypothetical protein